VTGPEFIDTFSDARPAGNVIGTTAAEGVTRKGIDKEGVIAIDNGALRFQPLVRARWGRSGLSYGPYQRRNGLAFGISILNGHNTSQTGPLPEGLLLRLKRWVLGSETEAPLTRLRRWARSPQRKYFFRHLLQWSISGSRYLQTATVDENLAVGWFPREVPTSPPHEGSAMLMHALGPECGELWTRVGRATLRANRGVQNVPMYFVVVLREQGAVYYAASVPGVAGLDAYPTMTPIAVDPFNTDPTVYAGVHQSVLGQVGFRVDTRVYRTQVAQLPRFDRWFGSAAGADQLTGDGPLPVSAAATGDQWTMSDGAFERTANGLRGVEPVNRAFLRLGQPSGLVHMLVETDEKPIDGIGLLFRLEDARNFFMFEVGTKQCALAVCENGVLTRFPATRENYLAPKATNSVQVFDDGQTIRLYVNGELVYGTHLTDARFGDAHGIGLQSGPTASGVLRNVEAHPRHVPIPSPLDLGEPWNGQGTSEVARDGFDGQPGELADRRTEVGAKVWRKAIGIGEFRLTGDGAAKVQATLKQPCPGRTAYTIPWENPTFADLSVEITPPGTQKGLGERGRGGVIFWQDDENYITLSLFLDDWYGMSIAVFFYRDGYEELYDAIWSNIGRRVHWGMPYSFRVAFDSERFTAYVNDEPVLHRALSDAYADWRELKINQVGLVANWEWGSDTGTVFRRFSALDRR
jgi:hypothetical protein